MWISESMMPGFEGANIGLWVGFKQFSYLAEHALLDYCAATTASVSELVHEQGLGVDLRRMSARLPQPLFVEDEIVFDVHSAQPRVSDGTTATFAARTLGEGSRTVMKGRAEYCLRPLERPGSWRGRPVEVPAEAPVVGLGDPHVWSQQIPYFYCRYSDPVQFDGYVRMVEDGVDRFLAAKGLSIPTVLRDRGWIPAVTEFHISSTTPVYMGEDVQVSVWLTDITADMLFALAFDFSVLRDGQKISACRAQITHGYAATSGDVKGGLRRLDGDVKALLRGGSADEDAAGVLQLSQPL